MKEYAYVSKAWPFPITDLDYAMEEFAREAIKNFESYQDGIEFSDKLVKISYRRTLLDRFLATIFLMDGIAHHNLECELMNYTLPLAGWKNGYV